MVRTTLYLPEDPKLSLERMVARLGRSQAQIIREAIRTSLEGRRRARPRLPLSSRGLGDPSAARRADELLGDFRGA